MRTAVFGGSFNPPHEAHLQLVDAIWGNGYADSVLLIPAFRPPHKPESPLADYRHRLAMTRLAVADRSWAEVSDIESRRPELPSYTFDTMVSLEQLYPDTELCLLIGSDSLLQLHTWYRADDLVRRWQVLSYPRPGNIPDANELRRHWPEEVAKMLAATLLPLPKHDLSSTELRRILAQGQGIAGMTPLPVAEYITKNQLYR